MNIENKKQLSIILLAVGLGLVAAFLTSQYVQKSIQDQTKLLAKEYEKKNAGMIKEVELLKKELKKTQEDAVKLIQQQVQQQAKSGAGGQAAAAVDKTALSYITPPGKRAITIMIDSLSAVGGLISPGDSVDIIARLNLTEGTTEAKKSKEITSVLFQNIHVLAVNTNLKPEGNSVIYQAQQTARSLNITLAVTAEEAGLLAFAQANGKLQLMLRSPEEKSTEVLQVASWDSLSSYLLDRQGTELDVPVKSKKSESTDSDAKAEKDDVNIQIFRGGKEL
jgi:Flp pilus assembly protein CpaB